MIGFPWRRLADEICDALYPRRCIVCSEACEEGTTCDEHTLPRGPSGNRCPRCAARLPDFALDAALCPACRLESPPWSRLSILADYGSDALRAWILAFKHAGRRDLARPLARARANASTPERPRETPSFDGVDVLVPVPLHFWRRIERGYDQALELARELGQEWNLPVRRALVRRRYTEPQGSPTASARTTNLAGAIGVRAREEGALAGRTVALIDDVVTSGATAAECTRLLMRAGAKRVDVIALARAVTD